MRLHHLSVTAFGPFVETADIDFDTLSEAGLFLLSGATGAGKSSVLDAVCFALYGAVPGDRQQAGRLRCDQAPPLLAPSVTLELSIGARRLRIVRSPAWRRPKKRGEGTTTEQARVTLSEHVEGAWVHLTGRLDEAGDLLSGLLGMSLDQFCQVALLPQGQVQAFLRARPDERQRLLARLFRTGRFERVEAWLRDHRLTLRRESDAQAATVHDLVSRLSEASGRALPDEMIEGAADPARVPTKVLSAWGREVRGDAAARRTSCEAEADSTARRHEAMQEELRATRALADARARVVAAAETVEALELAAGEHADDLDRLERARRAAATRPLATLVRERAEALVTAEEEEARARTRATQAGLGLDRPEAEQQRLADELAALTALLPAEEQLAGLRDRVITETALSSSLEQEQQLAEAETVALTAVLADLERRVTETVEAAGALPAVQAELAARRAEVAAHEELARTTVEHGDVRAEHAAAHTRVLDLRERVLDLRERRIAGMAAELAGGLVVGGDCPVCGSAEHPHPAAPSEGQTDEAAERAAQHDVDDAQAVEHALALRVAELDTTLTRLCQAVGGSDPVTARAELADGETDLRRLTALAEREASVRSSLAEAAERRAALATASEGRRLRLAELATSRDHLQGQAAALEARVAEARGGHPELRQALQALTEQRDLARAVAAEAHEAAAARSAHADAVTALRRAVLEAGFASADEARAAELPGDALSELERRVHDHRTALTTARAVLDDHDAWQLLTTPGPDLAASEAAALAAADALRRAREAAAAAGRIHTRVEAITDRLDAALAVWQPVREALSLATGVSAFAEGKAADNRLQMRLSAYVLAFRLSQVVAAANARLAGMSDRRYALEHVPERGARETRGGLSLVVRDDWSGDARDPATLSGGETFVVSLALALGLADVVAHEAGGIDLQTLFVDEGFGALDAETLDDVLDILDGLRENGRTVGVVSHVSEMRDRIPAQLLVAKARTGSTVQVVGG